MVGEETRFAPIIERGRDRFETQARPSIDVAPHVFVEAEYLLDDDDAALALAFLRGVVGGKGEMVLGRALHGDHVAHVALQSCPQSGRGSAVAGARPVGSAAQT